MQYVFKTILNLDVRMPFDTDSIDMVMDNSANVFIFNNKSLLRNYRPLDISEGIETVGENAVPEGVGDMTVYWHDNNGKEHCAELKNVLYCPRSPVNVFSVTKYAQSLAGPNDGSLSNAASIETFAYHSEFKWNHRKNTCTIMHLASSLPVMSFNIESNYLLLSTFK